MAIQRDTPYGQFNFIVDLGTGETDGPRAGFQEISGLGIEVGVSEYRNGNDRENGVRKIPGLAKYPDITLKRGVIGSLDLYQWIDAVRNGDAATRGVRIELQTEDHANVVLAWKLGRARIVKYVTGPLNARGTHVAIEEMVIAYERLELE